MGLGYSTESDGTMDDIVGKEYGFRVHRVEPNSPGQKAGLQSILDYIVVVNGVRLDTDDGVFIKMIQENKGKELRLVVFNTHTLRTRETILTPSDTWGGTGLLGITIRFDVTQAVEKHTLHVLNVYPQSPASAAGLDAYNDYILGVGDLLFSGPDEFGEIVQCNCNRPVRLYVFNARSEDVREIMITPDRSWGGDGCLGCGVGSGYLHSLPRRRDLISTRREERVAPTERTEAGAQAEAQAGAQAGALTEAPTGALDEGETLQLSGGDAAPLAGVPEGAFDPPADAAGGGGVGEHPADAPAIVIMSNAEPTKAQEVPPVA